MSHAHIPMHIAQTKSTQRKAKQKSNLLKSCKQISILLIWVYLLLVDVYLSYEII